MTKLMEWLLAASIVFSVWIALITGTSNLSNVEWYYKWFPAILIITFGLYAVIVILYRVFTFNNCESAAVELKRVSKHSIIYFIKLGNYVLCTD